MLSRHAEGVRLAPTDSLASSSTLTSFGDCRISSGAQTRSHFRTTTSRLSRTLTDFSLLDWFRLTRPGLIAAFRSGAWSRVSCSYQGVARESSGWDLAASDPRHFGLGHLSSSAVTPITCQTRQKQQIRPGEQSRAEAPIRRRPHKGESEAPEGPS